MGQIDACIEAVASSFLHALVVGSILLAAIFVFCRLFPRIPASIRFGLWWLGCAKILISLLCTVSIPLVLIVPRSFTPRFGAPKSAVQSIWRQIVPTRTLTKPMSHLPALASAHSPVPTSGLAQDASRASEAIPEAPAGPLSFVDPYAVGADMLIFAWIIGVAFQLAGLCRAGAGLRRLLADSSPAPAPAELTEMARRLRLRRPVDFRTSRAVSSPLAAGLFRPVLVFPTDFAASYSPDEIRIAIAHELAHVRRGDVLLSLVPTLAKCLFFFHLLVHLAYRECLNCREEACDAIAIAATVTDPARYAALLLKTALTHPSANSSAPLAIPGMAAAHFHQLKRRLEAVRTASRPSPSLLTAGVLSLAALVLAVPYRIVLAASEDLKLIPSSPPPSAIPFYTLTDLGTLGGKSSDAMAINDAGEIVGSANNNRRSTSGHAFVYNGDQGMEDLGASIPYRHSVAAALNSRGEIVANAFDRSGRALAILAMGGAIRTLQGLPGYRFSRPSAINDSGDVVGTAQNPWPDARGAFRTRAFIYYAGAAYDLGTLGGPYSAATSINGAGEVVGKADLPATGEEAPKTHAFVTNAGSGSRSQALRDLGTLPGGTNSVATAINDAHMVAGVSEVAGGAHHGFRVAGGRMDDLGTLPGVNSSRAYALNAAGAIVGTAYQEGDSAQQNRRAVLWLPSAVGTAPQIVDLNDLLPPGSHWLLESARGINSRGQIVGQGLIGGERRAFLLTPR